MDRWAGVVPTTPPSMPVIFAPPMKNRLFALITAFVAVLPLLAQPPVPVNQKDAQGRKQGLWRKTWAESAQLRYEGHFHDLLNDVDKAVVMADIKSWLEAHLLAS